jgi:hypothetical protein
MIAAFWIQGKPNGFLSVMLLQIGFAPKARKIFIKIN